MVKIPFQKDGLYSKTATTGKVGISEKLKAEIETVSLCSVVQKINERKIPSFMIINLDQAPSKFVPGCNKRLAKMVCKSVPIAGSTDKRMITATFFVRLSRECLPIQLIYGGKTKKSIPPLSFTSDFLITAKEKQQGEGNIKYVGKRHYKVRRKTACFT